MFVAARTAPRIGPRIGNMRLLAGGVAVALVGMVLLGRITPSSHYLPTIALPMLLLGTGIGAALTPLTTAGVAGVAPGDAGAASGLVNVAQQLGASLGLGILVTVFAAASHVSTRSGADPAPARAVQTALAHGVSTALRGSAVFLAVALVVVVTVMWRPGVAAARADAMVMAGALED
jgi:hypothetical protein